MAVITWFLSSLLSIFPLVAVIVILILTTKLLLQRKKDDFSWANGIPEIKPGLFFGNDDMSGNHFNLQYENHYKALKGLRYGLWHNGGPLMNGEKKLFILSPDLVAKILITDFDHFANNSFFSKKYTKVRYRYFIIFDIKCHFKNYHCYEIIT